MIVTSKTILLSACILCSSSAIAQQAGNLIYIEAGLGGGSVFSLKAGVNYVFHKTNVLSLTLHDQYKTSPYAPSDYQGGLFEKKPKDVIVAGALTYGKIIYSRSNDIRTNLKAGIAFGNITYKTNFRKPPPTTSIRFGANYDYDVSTKSIAGIVLNPCIEFPYSQAFGLSLGFFSIIFPETSSFGMELTFLLGKVRHRRER